MFVKSANYIIALGTFFSSAVALPRREGDPLPLGATGTVISIPNDETVPQDKRPTGAKRRNVSGSSKSKSLQGVQRGLFKALFGPTETRRQEGRKTKRHHSQAEERRPVRDNNETDL